MPLLGIVVEGTVGADGIPSEPTGINVVEESGAPDVGGSAGDADICIAGVGIFTGALVIPTVIGDCGAVDGNRDGYCDIWPVGGRGTDVGKVGITVFIGFDVRVIAGNELTELVVGLVLIGAMGATNGNSDGTSDGYMDGNSVGDSNGAITGVNVGEFLSIDDAGLKVGFSVGDVGVGEYTGTVCVG